MRAPLLSCLLVLACTAVTLPSHVRAEIQATATAPANPQTAPAAAYDAELAAKLGGNEAGMRSYVLVVLKTGPTKVSDEAARKRMFEGHFANMARLAAEKKLVFAGPLDGEDGWRGIFIFATGDLDEARRLVATDPVIINGEMVAEYHKLFGSAGLMMVTELHKRIQKK